jgi:DNA-binding MarR family transcriptional regulator
VANYLGMTRGTVSQSLIILEKKGFVEKIQDQNDKRVIHLKLLAAGEDVLKQARSTDLFGNATQILQTGLATAPTDVNVFQQALTALQKANQSQSFGVCKTCRNFREKDNGYFCELTQEALSPSDINQICQEHTPV